MMWCPICRNIDLTYTKEEIKEAIKIVRAKEVNDEH